MADLNPLAKRIHNVTPDPVRLELDDGSAAVFHMSWTEFFQQEFRAEGSCADDEFEYRFISSEDNDRILVGRKAANDEGWTMYGHVVSAEAAETSE